MSSSLIYYGTSYIIIYLIQGSWKEGDVEERWLMWLPSTLGVGQSYYIAD